MPENVTVKIKVHFCVSRIRVVSAARSEMAANHSSRKHEIQTDPDVFVAKDLKEKEGEPT